MVFNGEGAVWEGLRKGDEKEKQTKARAEQSQTHH